MLVVPTPAGILVRVTDVPLLADVLADDPGAELLVRPERWVAGADDPDESSSAQATPHPVNVAAPNPIAIAIPAIAAVWLEAFSARPRILTFAGDTVSIVSKAGSASDNDKQSPLACLLRTLGYVC